MSAWEPCEAAPIGIVTNCAAMNCAKRGCAVEAAKVAPPVSLDDLQLHRLDAVSDCPHCPDGHRDPAQANWGVFVASDRDGDGQPTHLRVEKVNGSHCADSDADWLWQLIRWATTDGEESCEPVQRPALGPTWGRTGRAG